MKKEKMSYFKIIFILFLSFGFLFLSGSFKNISVYAEEDQSDAIAVRIFPNPEHYSPLRWYLKQGFSGEPVAMKVDGYEAVRDGRTVYVNVANVSLICSNYSHYGNPCITDNDCGGMPYSCTALPKRGLYTNIYLISYNQSAGADTLGIFDKILENWKFNTNLTDFGVCAGDTNTVCLSDNDCSSGDYCSSLKARITRDIKRLADIVETKEAIENYKNTRGNYPKLTAGTYLPGKTISTWPSWQTTFSSEIGMSAPLDPVNKLGDCGGDQYDATTCWNDQDKTFAGSVPGDLPDGSKALVYSVFDNGLSYQLCAIMESGLLIDGDYKEACAGSFSVNIAPQIECGSLTGIVGEPFVGYVSALDSDGDNIDINISGLPQGFTFESTGDAKQKKIYSANPSIANNGATFNVSASDGINTVNTSCSIAIHGESFIIYPIEDIKVIAGKPMSLVIYANHSKKNYDGMEFTFNGAPASFRCGDLPACVSNAECANTSFCDGAEFCDNNGICQKGSDPCSGMNCREDLQCYESQCQSSADCDDGVFCNGKEYCDSLEVCHSGIAPCVGDDELCNESTDSCYVADYNKIPASAFPNGLTATCYGQGHTGFIKSDAQMTEATTPKPLTVIICGSQTVSNIDFAFGPGDKPSFCSGCSGDYYRVVYKGTINLPETGIWSFASISDDNSDMFIDGKPVLNYDGSLGQYAGGCYQSGTTDTINKKYCISPQMNLSAGNHSFIYRFSNSHSYSSAAAFWITPTQLAQQSVSFVYPSLPDNYVYETITNPKKSFFEDFGDKNLLFNRFSTLATEDYLGITDDGRYKCVVNYLPRYVGKNTITVQASNKNNEKSTEQTFEYESYNTAPKMGILNCQTNIRKDNSTRYRCEFTASDPEGHEITSFNSSLLPPGLTVYKDSRTNKGVIEGVPSVVGRYDISITATDQFGLTSEPASYVLNVNSYCGDGIIQSPNTEGSGGSNGDGYEECDNRTGIALLVEESSVAKQYVCDDKCRFFGGWCGDAKTQNGKDGTINHGEKCDFGANINCCNTCNWTTGPYQNQNWNVEEFELAQDESIEINLPKARGVQYGLFDVELENVRSGIAVTFVTDTSGSMILCPDGSPLSSCASNRINLVKPALIDAIKELQAEAVAENRNVFVRLINYSTTVSAPSKVVNLRLASSLDIAYLTDIINLYFANWGTNTKEALEAAEVSLRDSELGENVMQKTIVLLSDGHPINVPSVNLASSIIKDLNIDIYTVAFVEGNIPEIQTLRANMCGWSSGAVCDLSSNPNYTNNFAYTGANANAFYDSIVKSIINSDVGIEYQIYDYNGSFIVTENIVTDILFNLASVECDPSGETGCTPDPVTFQREDTAGGNIKFSNFRLRVLPLCEY